MDIDIGCDNPALRIVEPCLTQDIPDPRLTATDAEEARARLEAAFPGARWSDPPAWAVRYGVAPVGLYSPLFFDGEPVFPDSLLGERVGVVVWFSDKRLERVLRIVYAPVSSCRTSPVYVRQINGVQVTYTFGRWEVERGSDELYDMVTGEFVLPSGTVSMEFADNRTTAPSEDMRAEEFLSWARSIIEADSSAQQ